MTTAAQPLASEQEARDVVESARESAWVAPSFVRDLFLGDLRLDLIDPFPTIDPAEEARAKPFLDKLHALLERVDADEIDRTGEIPEELVQELRAIGAFGIKIPQEYGGLGLSQLSYIRAMEMVASKDGSLTALLSASQSIGVPQPLKLFGTDEQKRRYFPRLARGAISAFALTEVDAGSDPANLQTTATPSEDGQFYLLNGEKLWCTNGTRAELFVVMARTPDQISNGKPKKQITAFIVEADWPGVEIAHRLHFMGLKAIENGVIRFHNVKVPRENILWGVGKGLKLALITLNTGRLTLPANAVGVAKSMLQIAREWSKVRVQWGKPIGTHEAVAQKIGKLAAYTFAMESVAELTSMLADRGGYDIRLEAAIAKLWNSEAGWRIVDDTLQIRGGRGYETAESLARRGDWPAPVERAMRDFRINLIFEGSSEVMRLFIAREAVDTHLTLAGDMIAPRVSMQRRWQSARQASAFYARWYPRLWISQNKQQYREFGRLAKHLRYSQRTARRLARAIFHAMLRFGPKLEHKQMVLFRAVDIGAEVFAIAATCSRARMLAQAGDRNAVQLADLFCREARLRIEEHFRHFFGPNDAMLYRTAQQVLNDEYRWLEQGIVALAPPTPIGPTASSWTGREEVADLPR